MTSKPAETALQADQLSDEARRVVAGAQDEAARRHGNYLDVEHLALALLSQPAGVAHDLLAAHGVDTEALYAQIAGAVGMERPTRAEVRDISRWARDAFARAQQEAAALGQSPIHSGHLLLAVLGETEGAVHDVFASTSLDADALRSELRADPPQVEAAAPRPRTTARPAAGAPAPGEPIEYVLVPERARRKQTKQTEATERRRERWPLILAGLAVFLVYLYFALPGSELTTFVIVLIGWVFSVTLHEFSHALVAYIGGDHTVKDKGYLSFNPLKYTHPMLSIGLPLLFLAIGGIGLPGGAVYIERHRLRSKWWGAAVSAAGPAANLLLAIVLSLPFLLDKVESRLILRQLSGLRVEDGTIWSDPTLWTAVAFLAMLQVTAVVFNLIPVPPLDGYGVIEPLLDARTQMQFRQIGAYSLMLIFVALWFVPSVSDGFWNMVFQFTSGLSIPTWLISEGFRNFMFWTPS